MFVMGQKSYSQALYRSHELYGQCIAASDVSKPLEWVAKFRHIPRLVGLVTWCVSGMSRKLDILQLKPELPYVVGPLEPASVLRESLFNLTRTSEHMGQAAFESSDCLIKKSQKKASSNRGCGKRRCRGSQALTIFAIIVGFY